MNSSSNDLADLLAIQILNVTISDYLNRGEVEAIADCFSNKAIYCEGNVTIQDRSAITTWLISVRQEKTRYIFSHPRITLQGDNSASGTSVRATFSALSEEEQRSLGASQVADVTDVYEMGADGRWRIAQRFINPVA